MRNFKKSLLVGLSAIFLGLVTPTLSTPKELAKEYLPVYYGTVNGIVDGNTLCISDSDKKSHTVSLIGTKEEYNNNTLRFISDSLLFNQVKVYVYGSTKTEENAVVIKEGDHEPINIHLLENGLLKYDEKSCKYWFCNKFKYAGEEARTDKKGLWKPKPIGNPVVNKNYLLFGIPGNM